MRQILKNSHMTTGPIRTPQETGNCIYSIPFECGSSYIGETGRLWAVRFREHRWNLEEVHLERSRYAQHSFEENCQIIWKEAKILETETNSLYNKYKEVAYVMFTKSDQLTQHWNFAHLVSSDQQTIA